MLDQFMHIYIEKFDKGKAHKRTKEYRFWEHKLFVKRNEAKSHWNDMSEDEKKQVLNQIKELKRNMQSVPCKNPMDETFRRLKYVRYADDFLIGIIGYQK